MENKTQVGRLALRVEGDYWTAYYALPGTMEDAILIGKIHMGAATRHQKIKEGFMSLMQDSITEIVNAVTGENSLGGRTRQRYDSMGSHFQERKDHLRYLLLDIPRNLTKAPTSITNLAKSLGISRIFASGLFNKEDPLYLKMAVRLNIATKGYLEPIRRASPEEEQLLYPVTPEDWLELDKRYQNTNLSDQISRLRDGLEGEVKMLAKGEGGTDAKTDAKID